MSRLFAYCRVSTVQQVPENQSGEIKQAGYSIEPHRLIEEKISGSIPALQRPGFVSLLDKLEKGDTVVVTKLDRLGRDSIDIQNTVKLFMDKGVRLIVLQLGNLDLTSKAGELMVKLLAAIADFERGLIVERTQAGLQRVKSEGKRLGRKPKTTEAARVEIMAALIAGRSISEVARVYKISRALVHNIRAASMDGLPA